MRILVLPGDGIGAEVCAEALRVLDWFGNSFSLDLNIEEGLVGGASYDVHGVPLTEETLEKAKAADAVLFGAVGGPAYDRVLREHRPEAALLTLRKELDLFANLRPALVFAPLADASSLKADLVTGLDILILRELTSGVYFGKPRGITTNEDGSRTAVDTCAYTEHEITRIAEVGFDLAAQRSGLLHSVEKANVMETGVLWREIVTDLHAKKYADTITLQHMLADNCSMQLVRYPKQFDVILTDNLFGDMLSDTVAMVTGSLGMLPSASLGAKDPITKKQPALYEPVHGSAPDIAGQNKANPLATILSVAMMLKYSFRREDLSTLLTQAVEDALADGIRSGDTAIEGEKVSSCREVGNAILEKLESHDR